MERKAAQTGRRKPAKDATAWAVAALVVWCAVLLTVAAFSGLFGALTRHDLLIGALGLCFVLMAFASVAFMRHDLRDYLSSSRDSRSRARH